MEEPVILESGFTYEKEKIMEHFQYNGSFDPITREKVNPEVLIFNKHIK
jgi:STIP1 family protein 1